MKLKEIKSNYLTAYYFLTIRHETGYNLQLLYYYS